MLAVVLGGLALVFSLPYIAFFLTGLAMKSSEPPEPWKEPRPTQAIMKKHGLSSDFPEAEVATRDTLEYRHLDSEEQFLAGLEVIRDYTPRNPVGNSSVEGAFGDQLWSFTHQYDRDMAIELMEMGSNLTRGLFGSHSIELHMDCEQSMTECFDELVATATEMIDVASFKGIQVYRFINLTIDGDKTYNLQVKSTEGKQASMRQFEKVVDDATPEEGGRFRYPAEEVTRSR